MSETRDTTPPTSEPAWLNLADATRVTNRHDSTLKAWILASAPLDERKTPTTRYQPGASRPDRFYRGEVERLDVMRGTGQAYKIKTDALKRVHEARGGVYWNLSAAAAAAALPPHLASELSALRTENVTLRDRLEALERQLSASAPIARSYTPPASQTPYVPALGDLSDEQRARIATFTVSHPSPASTPRAPRPIRERQATSVSPGTYPPLPHGFVAVSTVAKEHGINHDRRATWRNSVALAKYVDTGPYEFRGRVIYNAIDDEGLRAFGRYIGGSKYFTPCMRPGCLVCAAAREVGHPIPALVTAPLRALSASGDDALDESALDEVE